MSIPADMKVDKVEYNGRVYYKGSFMGISVVMTEDNYYNATIVCKDNGISDFGQISRKYSYQKHFNAIKNACLFDMIDKKFVLKKQIDKAALQIPQTSSIDLNNEASIDMRYRDVCDEDLSFLVQSHTSETAWITGTYLHEFMFHNFLYNVDDEYSVTIDYIISLMNSELKARNIELEDKIHEQEQTINSIRIQHEESGRGHNHDTPGCIILRKIKGTEDCYKISSDTKTRTNTRKISQIFVNVFNPERTCLNLQFYIKSNVWPDCEWVCIDNNRKYGYKIKDMNKFADHISSVQFFDVSYPSEDILVKNALKSQKFRNSNLEADMFEIYCSINYGIKLSTYETTEQLSLSKKDTGLDLLDIKERRMGQCKNFIRTTLSENYLEQFLEFCRNYPDYKHELYINDRTEYSFNPSSFNIELDIIRVPYKEFIKWYYEKTEIFDDEHRYQAARRFINITKDEYLKLESFVVNALNDNDFLYFDEFIERVNKDFGGIVKNDVSFGRLFGHLYRHPNNYDRGFVKGLNDRPILVSIEKQIPDFYVDEREKLIQYIKNGMYTDEEINKVAVSIIGHEITSNKYLRTNHKIFVTTNGGDNLIRRTVNGKLTKVYELNENVYPNKYEELWEFIKPLLNRKESYASIAKLSNAHFHRYDGTDSIRRLIQMMSERFK